MQGGEEGGKKWGRGVAETILKMKEMRTRGNAKKKILQLIRI